MQSPQPVADQINVTNVPEPISRAFELRNKGDWDNALKQALECEKQMPQAGTVKFLLGILYFDQKDYQKALHYFTQAKSLDPQNEYYYVYAAKTLQKMGVLDVECLEWGRCLQINPNNILALIGYGQCLVQQSDFRNAIKIFKSVIKKDNSAMGFYQIGKIHLMLQKPLTAIPWLQNAVKMNSQSTDFLNALAQAYIGLSKYPMAKELLIQAIHLEPENVHVLHNMIGVCLAMNDYKETEQYCNRLMDLNDNNGFLWYAKTRSHTYTNDSTNDVKTVQNKIERCQNINEIVYFRHALANIYDNLGDYDSAFEQIKLANASISSHFRKPLDYQFFLLNWIKRTFTKNEVNRTLSAKHSPVQPLFVLGLPRSGKSILEQLLSQHEAVHDAGEIGLSQIFDLMDEETIPLGAMVDWYGSLCEEVLDKMRSLYLERITDGLKEGAKIVCDTIPSNVEYLGLIQRLFPNARYIHVIRDKLDLGCEIYFKRFAKMHYYASDPEQIVKHYTFYDAAMAHWKKVLGKNIIDVHYEELVQNPQITLDRVFGFLTIDKQLIDCESLNHSQIGLYRQKYAKRFPELEMLFKSKSTKDLSFDPKVVNQAIEQNLKAAAINAFHLGQNRLLNRVCKHLLEYNSSSEQANFFLAKLHLENSQYPEAEQCAKQVLNQNTNNISAYKDLVESLQKQGRQMEAEYWKQLQLLKQKEQHVNSLSTINAHEKNILLSVFSDPKPIEQENYKNILVEGQVDEEHRSSSYITRSWDRYFNDLSHGSFRSYNTDFENPWRMRTWYYLFKNMAIIDKIYKTKKPKLHILDIGCSSGYLRRFLEGNFNPREKKQIFYWGVDIRKEMLESAVNERDNIESGASGIYIPSCYVQQDITKGLPFKSDQFDYVVNFEMIKYLPVQAIQSFFHEMYRVLVQNGMLFVSTSFSERHPGYVESMGREALEAVFTKAGFSVVGSYGSQTSLKELIPYLKQEHVPFINELAKYYPEEMVIAMLAPLYPLAASQITYHLRK